MTARRIGFACLAVALFSLWLRSGVPILGIAGARDDDGLFVEMARQLAAGHWLGPFYNRTLVKGMGYPLFIHLAQASGIPLKMAEHGVYLAASWLLAWLILRRGNRPVLALLVFTALALDPVVWTAGLARVIREGLYLGLSPAVVGLAVAALFPTPRRLDRLMWGALAGLAGGAFWLTREEGVWLFPAFGVVVAGAVLDLLVWQRAAASRLEPAEPWVGAVSDIAVPAFLAVVVALGMVAGVAATNARHYGAFVDNEVKAAPFRHAYGALARITPDHWRRFVVFPVDARARAYAASPAALELKPTLDGPVGEAWRRIGCTQTGASDCTEILAGWFQWALRDAAAAAGHYRTAADAAAFYDRLAAEIDAACASGRLACGPPRASLAPPFRWASLVDAAGVVPLLTGIVFRAASDNVVSFDSQGRSIQNATFADMVGPLAQTGPRWSVHGQAAAPGAPPMLSLRPRDGGAVDLSLDIWPAPPDADVPPGLSAIGFDLETNCPPKRCELVARGADGASLAASLADPFPIRLAASGVVLRVDQVSPRTSDAEARHRRANIGRITRGIAAVYGVVLPVAGGLACLGLLVALARWRTAPPSILLLTLALASAAAVASRIALLSYLEVTAIPSANGLYASPAMPFAILFAILGCWLGVAAVGPMPANRTRRP